MTLYFDDILVIDLIDNSEIESKGGEKYQKFLTLINFLKAMFP